MNYHSLDFYSLSLSCYSLFWFVSYHLIKCFLLLTPWLDYFWLQTDIQEEHTYYLTTCFAVAASCCILNWIFSLYGPGPRSSCAGGELDSRSVLCSVGLQFASGLLTHWVQEVNLHQKEWTELSNVITAKLCIRLVMILCVWSIIFTSIYHQGFAKDEDHVGFWLARNLVPWVFGRHFWPLRLREPQKSIDVKI